MSSIFFGFFPAAERVLVGLILERAQVSPTDAKFSKVIFSGPQLPEQVREMVTFVHGGLSRTYAAPEQGGWIGQFAMDVAGGALDGTTAFPMHPDASRQPPA